MPVRKKKRRPSYADTLRDLGFVAARKGSHVLWQIEWQKKVTDQHLSTGARTTIEAGRKAWERIKSSSRQRQSYHDWAAVNEALEIAEAECAKQAGKSEGGAYARLLSAWLRLHDMDDLSKSIRLCLREIRKQRGKIEAWRNHLTVDQRARLNHPCTILQHYNECEKQQQSEST
jgi:hypothetical protein